MLGDFVAAHPRKANVQQNDVRQVLLGHLQRFRPTVGQEDLVAPQPQEDGNALPGVHVVIHYEDTPGDDTAPAARLSGSALVWCLSQGGQPNNKLTPLARPLAGAVMLPPCNSTNFLTTVRPIPSPPLLPL